MNVLFLDIDGVLNSLDWYERRAGSLGIEATSRPANELDPFAVERLNRVMTATGCSVVISSTWRLRYSPQRIAAMLVRCGLNPSLVPRFIGSTDNDAPPFDMPNRTRCGRGMQIQRWLDAHDVERFAIVDDDSDMGHLLPHLVQTSHDHGMLDEHADALIAALGASR